jgi:fluoride exporter
VPQRWSWVNEPTDLDPEVEPQLDATHRARPTINHALIVFLGGAGGVLARYALLRSAPTTRDAIPWMLVVLNVLGAALLGIVVARVLDLRPGATSLRLLLATGFLGGFTTYSSLVSAAIVSGHDGHLGNGFVTLLGTAVAGVLAAGISTRVSRIGVR